MTTSGSEPPGPAEPWGPAAGPGAPTCYRHPARETWIRCQRCERPICPDCMRQASVGFQCPECVAEGNRAVRAPRTMFGGRVPARPGLVTLVLIGLTALSYLAQWTIPGYTERLVNIGYAFTSTGEIVGVADAEWWRLLSAAFLHDERNIIHILLNMLALFWLGPALEQAFGRARFVVLYVLAALGGSIASYLISPPNQPSLGASTAVFGIFGATLVMSKRLRLDASGIALIIGVNIVFSIVYPGIDLAGHVGGLITGSLVAAAFAYAPRARRVVLGWAACAAVLAVEVGLVLWRTAQLVG